MDNLGSSMFLKVVLMLTFITFCLLCNSSWVMVQAYRKNQEPAVSKLKEPILDEITSALIGRHYLNFTREDTSSLWFLCKQVITNFNPSSFCALLI